MTAGRRAWAGLAVLALPTLLVTMDLSVLFLAVPKLTRDLHPSSFELLWITDIYGFLIAASLITMGTIGDRIGRRRLLMIGSAAFGLASALAAFSTSPAMLIAARALLGIAGGTLAPSSLALIRNLFADPGERQSAIAIWISCFAAGAAIGPLLGGLLLQNFWWGSVFLPNVPVMALLLVSAPSLLPESRDPNPGTLDLVSAAISLTAVLAVVYGLTSIAERGPGVLSVVLALAGLAAGAVFVRRQRRLSYPLVDVALFRSPMFSGAFVALLVSVFIIGGTDLFISQYIQLVHGVEPLVTGLWLLPGVISLIVGSMLAPALVRFVRPGVAIVAGLGVSAAGLLILAELSTGSSLVLVASGATLLGLGIGPIGALGTDILVGAAPPERAGAASAVSETATELGGALGIALLGAVGTAVYRSMLADDLPAGVGPATAGASRNTLGAAVQASGGLHAGLGQQLLHAARAAFTDGFTAAATAATAITIIAAILAAITLRTASVPGTSQEL